MGRVRLRVVTEQLMHDGEDIVVAQINTHPSDLVVWEDGRYFVATNGAGVLEVSPEADAIRQLLLRPATH